MPEIKLDGRVIRRFNQRLFCLLSSDLWQINQTIKWQGEHAVSWDAVPVLLTNIRCNQQPLEIGNAPFSLRFTPVGELQSKPLNQWFKQWQIAPWLRQQTVVVRAGESVIALAIAGEKWRLSQQALDWQFKADISRQ
ncbi:TilS substrate C-terminal domain-containing protein [Pseudobowmanella zhangzhouensis]